MTSAHTYKDDVLLYRSPKQVSQVTLLLIFLHVI